MECYKNSSDNFILVETSEIEGRIDEHLINLSSLVVNKYSEPMR